jgi:hypothetical protein
MWRVETVLEQSCCDMMLTEKRISPLKRTLQIMKTDAGIYFPKLKSIYIYL